MNKIAATIATAALATAGLAVTAQPAAAVKSDKVCATSETSRYGKTVSCLQVDYKRQRDGSGVYANGYWTTTPDGCGRLEDPYPYEDTLFQWVDKSGDVRNGASGGSQFNCDDWTPVKAKGSDKGRMLLKWAADMRIDGGRDRRVGMAVWLNTDLSSDPAWAYSVDDTSRGMSSLSARVRP